MVASNETNINTNDYLVNIDDIKYTWIDEYIFFINFKGVAILLWLKVWAHVEPYNPKMLIIYL